MMKIRFIENRVGLEGSLEHWNLTITQKKKNLSGRRNVHFHGI